MTTGLDEVAHELRHRLSDERVLLVGLDGFGGSGKSTIAAKLIDQLEEGIVVAMDDYIVKEHMSDDSWEHGWDRSRLIDEVLRPLRRGELARPRKLDWDTNSLGEQVELTTSRLVVIEGITSLHPDLFDFYDYTVWISTPIETAKQRGAARDVGNENETKWDAWALNDLRYLSEYHPELRADALVPN